ncbi:MAG: DUF1573 domain-containing protein [Bacteroidales bacterium]|nr:DUF1573 domain-containing protein [Bacteroidales bacterium]
MGRIADSCGVQEASFPFENVSGESVMIHVQTSCSCLKAKCDPDRLEPGASGTVSLSFDPYHMSGDIELRAMVTAVGPSEVKADPAVLEFHVFVETSDKWDYLPVRIGALALKRSAVSFPDGESVVRILCANTSEKALEPHVQLVPDFLEARFEPAVIGPGEEAGLVIRRSGECRKTSFAVKAGNGLGLIRVLNE